MSSPDMLQGYMAKEIECWQAMSNFLQTVGANCSDEITANYAKLQAQVVDNHIAKLKEIFNV